ncbi:MAG: efflux RND transporter periplasmic adaptor subunit [Candidatus Riflebacteria bacterium]|nr:efflux RND transporter periplasmic adaptor subunit [Candidatus Riflebacteria bacterium]
MSYKKSIMGALKLILKLTVLLGILGFVVYRLRFAPVKVESKAVVMGPIVSEVLGTGTLEARISATIGPRIPGMITQVLADQGDKITRGQLLVTLYDDDLRQQVEIAKAELAAMKAGIERAGAEIAAFEPLVVMAKASFKRSSGLHSQKIVSNEDLDNATQQRDVAEAQLKRARLAKIEIEQQAAKAQESLRYYQERLVDTKISSPFDGLVVRRRKERGDVVVAGGEVLQIIATDQLWVSAWVDETAIASIAVDQAVRVVFRSAPETSYIGSVTRIAPSIDRETREFLVDVTVRNLPNTWAIGQRAEVFIQTARKETALLVPQQCISWQKGQPGLFVNHAGHAAWRNVTVGLRDGENVEIVKGLASDDVVIWLADAKTAPLTEGRAVLNGSGL